MGFRLTDGDGVVVVDGTRRVGNLQGDRSSGGDVNSPSVRSTALLSKVLDGSSGRLSTRNNSEEVRS